MKQTNLIRNLVILFYSLLYLLCQSQNNYNDPENDSQHLIRVFRSSLANEILNVWYPASIDSVNGGFLADFTYCWKPTGPQDKMIVTQARHIWTASKAFDFTRDTFYLDIAKHGFQYLKEKMWDQDFGGFHTLLTSHGEVKQDYTLDNKTAYGNAFAIYALAGYYKVSGDSSALYLAIKTLTWLETHSFDPVHKGYYDKMQRDGNLYFNSNSDLTGIQLKRKQWKDYNSSIHLLEAFTELYTIWPDSILRERTLELLKLVRDTFIDERGFLKMYFESDWTPISYIDSARKVLEANYYYDHISFGHDVETAFLMLEASHTLKIPDDSVTLLKAKKLVDHALKYGWDTKKGGFYDIGYYFDDTSPPAIVSNKKVWWSQAEGLNSLLLMATLFPSEIQYYESFLLQWNYINTYLIDHSYGGWYFEGIDNSPHKKKEPKATIWKINYHNTRALMNCIRLLEEYNRHITAQPVND